MAGLALSTGQSATPRIRKRHVAAAVVGNALEFYDFATYGYFATQIGRTFFPSHSLFVSLMASYGAFGVGFVGRPIGAIVIGAYGDRVGRKPAMLLSFGLMGTALLGLALTPSYAAIGIAAPVLVLILRLIQGFALGGDVGPTTAFMLEAAPVERRGFYTSLQYASQGVSTLLSGLVGVILSSVLSEPALESFGWRIAFLLGAIILPIGLIIRGSLPETLHGDGAAKDTGGDTWRQHFSTIIAGFGILGGSTIGFYVLAYLTTYASQFLHMRANISFAATAIFGIANIISSPLSGIVSDRIGRRPVMIGSRLIFLMATIPAFMLLVHDRSPAVLLGLAFVLGCLSQAGMPGFISLTEALPRTLRSAWLSITYAFAIALFGGTTQPAVTALLHASGDLLAPAYYLTVGNVMALVAMLAMRETAPLVHRKTMALAGVRQRS